MNKLETEFGESTLAEVLIVLRNQAPAIAFSVQTSVNDTPWPTYRGAILLAGRDRLDARRLVLSAF